MNNSYLTPSQLKAKRKNFSILATLIVLIVITFVISMNTGVIKLTPMEVLRTLFGQGDAQQQLILYEFRLPRIVIAVLVGMGLAISGAILQGISKNALADPGILGINLWSRSCCHALCVVFPNYESSTCLFTADTGFCGGRFDSCTDLFTFLPTS